MILFYSRVCHIAMNMLQCSWHHSRTWKVEGVDIQRCNSLNSRKTRIFVRPSPPRSPKGLNVTWNCRWFQLARHWQMAINKSFPLYSFIQNLARHFNCFNSEKDKYVTYSLISGYQSSPAGNLNYLFTFNWLECDCRSMGCGMQRGVREKSILM